MPRTPRHRMRAVELAVHRAAKQAPWLTDSDAGALRLAKRLAETLDELYLSGGNDLFGGDPADFASRTTYTAQTLLRVLEQLGLTAKARADLGYAVPPDESDPLEDIRQGMADVLKLDDSAAG